MSEIIDKGITTSADIEKIGHSVNNRNVVGELIGAWKEERKEFFEKITELYMEGREAKSVQKKYKMSGQILKLLEKNNYTSEDIADVFGMEEGEVINILNGLIDQNLVRFNKEMEYVLVNEDDNDK